MITYRIKRGLFAGIEIPHDELAFIPADEAGKDSVAWWPVQARLPHFMEKFPVGEYVVRVESKDGTLQMPINPLSGSAVAPTQCFIARLLKGDQVIAEASTLETIDGPKKWEAGETNARGRLMDCLGLAGRISTASHEVVGELPAHASADAPAAGLAPAAAGAVVAFAPQASAQPASVATAGAATAVSVATAAAPAVGPLSNVTPAAPVQADGGGAVKVKPTKRRSEKLAVVGAKPAVDANLLQQIRTQAALRGTEVPALGSQEEAIAFYRELLGAPGPAVNGHANGVALPVETAIKVEQASF